MLAAPALVFVLEVGEMLALDSKEKLKGFLIRTASKSGDRM